MMVLSYELTNSSPFWENLDMNFTFYCWWFSSQTITWNVTKTCKSWDKVPTSTSACQISEPSTVSPPNSTAENHFFGEKKNAFHTSLQRPRQRWFLHLVCGGSRFSEKSAESWMKNLKRCGYKKLRISDCLNLPVWPPVLVPKGCQFTIP